MKMRISFGSATVTRTGLCAVVLCAIVIMGCDASSGGSAVANNTGGTLVVATAGDADNLFPPLTMTGQGRQVVDQIFDYLADIGPQLNTIGDAGFTPRLAKSWTWASDSMSIAFHLNERARWHDGKPVTANDVRFTFRLLTDSALGSPIAATLGGIDSVTARDSLTTVVWYAKRSPEQFFNFVYNVAVLPEHLLGNVPVKSLASSPFARQPVGSGRFRFSRWTVGRESKSSVTVTTIVGVQSSIVWCGSSHRICRRLRRDCSVARRIFSK